MDIDTLRYYPRSTTEFNAGTPPLRILDVLQDLLNLIFECDHPDWVRIRLPKYGTYSGNVVSSLQVDFLTENLGIAFDPVPAEIFNLFDIRVRNTRLMGKVEAQFGGGNKRSSLVDVVSEDFSERPVENMGSGVVVPERPPT